MSKLLESKAVSVIADALRILGRFFGLRPGPDVERIKDPPPSAAKLKEKKP